VYEKFIPVQIPKVDLSVKWNDEDTLVATDSYGNRPAFARSLTYETTCKEFVANTEPTDQFGDIVRPVIKWLAENANPHAKVIIDSTSAELVSGERSVNTEEYLRD
jgi:hypothetical protein